MPRITFQSLDLAPILDELGITAAQAAKMIALAKNEDPKTTHQRLMRWMRGEVPKDWLADIEAIAHKPRIELSILKKVTP